MEPHARGTRFYWVLLLELVANTPDTFRRVGMGIVWPKSCIEEQSVRRAFKLI